MKKRVLSFLLALLIFTMIPAETVLAMPDEAFEMEDTEGAETTEVPTDEPVAEKAEAATEIPVAEETEAPTEIPVIEETAEPTEIPEIVATAAPTEILVTEEALDPTEAPEAENAAVSTEMPTASPAAVPTVSPAKQDIVPAGRDMTAMVVGSNGIQYDNVVYLSMQTIDGMSKAQTGEYVEICDEIAALKESDAELGEIVIALDENGKLQLSVSIPMQIFSGRGVQGLLLADDEVVGFESFTDADTQMSNVNYFKNQLGSNEKKLYNAGKTAMVSKGKNTFSYSTSSKLSFANFCNVISALINTYPNSFNWIDYGNGGLVVTRRGGGTYTYKATIDKSPHYSAELEAQAKIKVSELVGAAKEYAKTSYPNDIVYGMVKYFNQWICENNYYNDIGTDITMGVTEEYFDCHSCYGVLLKGYGVCQSYALAMSRLLDAAGIRNQYVTGSADGAGHAWNYVQMPNGFWYLLDSTWNDDSYDIEDYFLLGSEMDFGEHMAYGRSFATGKDFKFYSLSEANYDVEAEIGTEAAWLNQIVLNKTTAGVKPGKSMQLTPVLPKESNYFYSNYEKEWTSSDTSVATVSKSGKVTGIKPGHAVITYRVNDVSRSCMVYVYQFTNMTFDSNGKTGRSYTYPNPDIVFDANDSYSIQINVNQKSKADTLEEIGGALKLNAPVVKSSKPGVASALLNEISEDHFTVQITPKKVGSTKITITFAGMNATYNLNVKYKLQEDWFQELPYQTKVYTGSAFEPTVKKSTSAPTNLTYSVTYSNHKNVSTEEKKATVTIKGTGNYTGTVTKQFTITPRSITNAKFTSCTSVRTYNGRVQKAVTVVKLGKKTLKAGTDYEILYNGETTVPANVGTYTVTIAGKGNYKDVLGGETPLTKTYRIRALKLDSVTLSCSETVKYKGIAVAPKISVKYNKKTIPATEYNITYKKADGTVVAKEDLIAKGTYRAVITPIEGGTNLIAGKKKQIVKTFKIVK